MSRPDPIKFETATPDQKAELGDWLVSQLNDMWIDEDWMHHEGDETIPLLRGLIEHVTGKPHVTHREWTYDQHNDEDDEEE